MAPGAPKRSPIRLLKGTKVCLSVCLSVCVPACLPVCLSPSASTGGVLCCQTAARVGPQKNETGVR